MSFKLLASGVLFFILSFVGCGSNRVYNIVGPDGNPNWVALSCKHISMCAKMAGEACPHGYTLPPNVGSHEGVSEFIFQCRGPAHVMCGGDAATHGCQGSSRWNEQMWNCDPC